MGVTPLLLVGAHGLTTSISVPATYYPEYCSKAGPDFAALRSIPALSVEARALGIRLIQVVTLLRHGARTPADKYNCWAHYDPQWNCNIEEVVQASLVNDTAPQATGFSDGLYIHPETESSSWLSRFFGDDQSPILSRVSLTFEKRYDAAVNMNILGGTCQKGQLIAEGFQQHQIIGHQFAKAYQVAGDQQRVPYTTAPPLIDLGKIDDDVYFRSTDMQRTILSGSSFLTAFFQTATNGKTSDMPLIPLHTMDLAQETFFPNVGSCPALIHIRDDIFTSSGYLTLRTKWRDVESRVRAATGRDDISDIWPGEIFDCILTAICPGRPDLLPEGLRPPPGSFSPHSEKTLIEELLEAVDDYAQYEYRYRDAIFSKSSVVYAVVDIKTEIVRAILEHLQAGLGLQATSLADVVGSQEQADIFQKLVESNPRGGTSHGAKRLVVFAGHDTSLMPFLASLGGNVFNNKWPPYAAQVIIEIYMTDDNPPASFFRLIYNGRTLTRDVPGCSAYEIAYSVSDVCPISVFFSATQWATPANAKKMCQGSPSTKSRKQYGFNGNPALQRGGLLRPMDICNPSRDMGLRYALMLLPLAAVLGLLYKARCCHWVAYLMRHSLGSSS